MGDRWENTAPSPATVHDNVPDELLEQVFLRLPSSLHLVHAACTYKRWRRVVADGGFLRRFRALHPQPVTAGHYRVDERQCGSCPPGCNPVFTLAPLADTTAGLRPHHFSLDFLPTCHGGFWDLADSRGGILLLHDRTEAKASPQVRNLVVCNPMSRRCVRVIAPPAFHRCCFLGAFLLDNGADEAGGCISLTNFRIIAALYDNGMARCCVFSSSNGNGGGWTVATSKPVNVAGPLISCILFAGHVEESAYWTNKREEILILDKNAVELKFSSISYPSHVYTHVLCSGSGIVRCCDGTVRIAILLSDQHLRVLIQEEGSDKWVEEKIVRLPQLIPEVPVDGGESMLTNIVSVGDGSITLGTKGGVGRGSSPSTSPPWSLNTSCTIGTSITGRLTSSGGASGANLWGSEGESGVKQCETVSNLLQYATVYKGF